MGVLSNIFGRKKNVNDGLWLKSYRDSEWSEVFSFITPNGAQLKTDVSIESCYNDGKGTYCILRTSETNTEHFQYVATVSGPSINEIIWIVERFENIHHECLREDIWHRETVFSEEKTPNIQNAIKKIGNYAGFNNYSSMPPYVTIAILNLNKWKSV